MLVAMQSSDDPMVTFPLHLRQDLASLDSGGDALQQQATSNSHVTAESYPYIGD